MSRKVDEQEQARKVKVRLRMIQHFQQVSRNVSLTCRFFGISRSPFYIWLRRYERQGKEGLLDRSRRPSMIRYRIPPEVIALILRIREERRYGAVRMSFYLQRHYQVYVSPTTVLKIFHRHRVTRVSLKRYRRGPKPQAAGRWTASSTGPVGPSGCQVRSSGRASQRLYQFTAIDEATRYRVLRVYDYNNTRSAVAFLDEVRRRLPFAIRRIQTDNDSSFGPQFTWRLADLGIAHRHIPPASPEVNGKVERSHKTDAEEFYRGRQFRNRKQLARKLKRW
jgi:transposase InsO family protein